jgi:REP element-mobilizing transposase RayT
VHVTLRVRRDVPSLRSARLIREFRRSLAQACERDGFRVVHYSLQSNHAHLLVAASNPRALACGMKSVGARLSRAVNRVFGRTGAVLDGRYHAVVLRTPRQVRAAPRYVLLNARHHARRAVGPPRIDPASSGRWFRGWLDAGRPARADPIGGDCEVARPRSWLLRTGWKRYGRIGLSEIPG